MKHITLITDGQQILNRTMAFWAFAVARLMATSKSRMPEKISKSGLEFATDRGCVFSKDLSTFIYQLCEGGGMMVATNQSFDWQPKFTDLIHFMEEAAVVEFYQEADDALWIVLEKDDCKLMVGMMPPKPNIEETTFAMARLMGTSVCYEPEATTEAVLGSIVNTRGYSIIRDLAKRDFPLCDTEDAITVFGNAAAQVHRGGYLPFLEEAKAVEFYSDGDWLAVVLKKDDSEIMIIAKPNWQWPST